jgi:hypothetical protein
MAIIGTAEWNKALDELTHAMRTMRRLAEVRNEATGRADHEYSEYVHDGQWVRQCNICGFRADMECEEAWEQVELVLQDAVNGESMPTLNWVALLPGALAHVPENTPAGAYLVTAGVWQARTPGEMVADYKALTDEVQAELDNA